MKRAQMVKARNLAIGAVTASVLLIGGLAGTAAVKQEEKVEGVDIKQVYAGANTSFVLDNDGQLWGKGLNNVGQLSLGDSQNRDEWSALRFGDGETIQEVSMGNSHGTALTDTNQVYTFGDNRTGVYGNGTKSVNLNPEKLSVSFAYKLVAGGENFILAYDTNNTLYAWGVNDAGQLGLGDTKPRTVPTPVPFTGGNIVSLKAGKNFAAALTEDGSVYMWGGNDAGQLGKGDTKSSGTPTRLDLPQIASINTNLTSKTMAALTPEGQLFMWGANSAAQLGNGEDWRQQIEDEKERVRAEKERIRLEDEARKEGLINECTVKAVKKWEKENPPYKKPVKKKTEEEEKPKPKPPVNPDDDETPPVDPDDEDETEPVDPDDEGETEQEWEWVTPEAPDFRPECVTEVEKDFEVTDTSDIKERKIEEPALKPNGLTPAVTADHLRFTYVSTGAENAAAVGVEGRLYTWGADKNGQNGNNINDPKSHTQVPKPVSPDTWDAHRYTQVEVSAGWSAAVTNMGVMQAWGSSKQNALAGAGKQSLIPVNIGEDVQSVYLNSQTGYYISTTGTLHSWGSNKGSALGIDTAASSSSQFAQIATDVTSVAPAGDSVVALRSSILYGWGTSTGNTFGEGEKEPSVSKTVRRIQEITTFADTSAGNRFSLAVDDDGRVWMWGADRAGVSLGIGNRGDTILYPVPLPLTQKVVSIYATDAGAYAITDEDTILSWGAGEPLTERKLPGGKDSQIFTGAHQVAILTPEGELHTSSVEPARSALVDDADETGDFVHIPGKFKTVSNSLTDQMIAMKTDGEFITWGAYDEDDAIGETYAVFNLDLPLRDITEISISSTHYLAFDKNKILWMWGEEPAGSFGNKGRIDIPKSSIFSPEQKEIQ